MDLAIFAVRELGPNYPYLGQGIKHSKTGKDKMLKLFSSGRDTIKHKKIPVSSTGKINLGQAGLEPVTFCIFLSCEGRCRGKSAQRGLYRAGQV